MPESPVMENLMNFFGRFHPLIVHFPIGILLMAFLFEVLSRSKRYRKLSGAVPFTLFLGALSAVAAAITGYFLSREGGYETGALNLHRTLGIVTAIFSVAVYFIRKNPKLLRIEKVRRIPIRILLFLPLVALITVTGHLGGSLTHGEDYLFAYIPFSPAQPPEDPVSRIKAIANPDEDLS